MNEKIAKPIIMLNEEKGQQFVLSNMRERNQEYFMDIVYIKIDHYE